MEMPGGTKRRTETWKTKKKIDRTYDVAPSDVP
jgi:hypothetical protein